ncbi:hypothetical protein lbkm_0545 [Lachnospiraceae bacterium KM106-2]|nr:hypothetical protein lbkm_0545 [Lachnospiraceae bacterium KM106-2]
MDGNAGRECQTDGGCLAARASAWFGKFVCGGMGIVSEMDGNAGRECQTDGDCLAARQRLIWGVCLWWNGDCW